MLHNDLKSNEGADKAAAHDHVMPPIEAWGREVIVGLKAVRGEWTDVKMGALVELNALSTLHNELQSPQEG